MNRRSVRIVLALMAILSAAPAVHAQPPAGEVEVVPVLVDTSRIESWSFFTPPEGDPDYTLFGNRVTLGMATATRHVEGYGAFQYAQLLNLPRFAFGGFASPTSLGPGGFYYDAARAPNAYQLYFKALSLRVRNLAHGLSFEVGRMSFESGAEAVSASPALASLARERLHGVLLGEVGWSAFERTFDGIRGDLAQPRWHANASLLFPSQGVFEESANTTMSGVRVATGSVTFWNSAALRPDVGPIARLARRRRFYDGPLPDPSSLTFEAQAFAQQYRDVRSAKVRPDNSFPSPVPADITVATFGGSVVSLLPVGRGRVDVLAWIAGQSGEWYGDPHRAMSLIVEGGYKWTAWLWQPWVRGGVRYASGDASPIDSAHGTFFPVLPSSQPALLAGVYAQMNLRDVFGEVRLQPRSRIGVRGSVHRLSLASGADRWYSGTGATAIRGDFFGYSGRLVFQGTDLGTLFQTSAEAELTKRWTVRGSFGMVKIGGVPARLGFLGNRLTVVALENLLTF